MQNRLIRAKHNFFLIFAFVSAFSCWAVPLDFYGTISSSSDTNMISMTTDLFYNQIQTISGYQVNDKRSTLYNPATASNTTIAFYTEIQEAGNGGWICTITAVKASTNKSFSLTKTYASYYMILMDAKDSITNVLQNLDSAQSTVEDRLSSSAAVSADLESLAGTWACGSLIDKIVILRGGRGFVIFKNGASMNITLAVKGSTVTVTQSGKSNASFFPELSREVAIKMAPSAAPITWTLTMTDANTLSGSQTTLLPDENSTSGASRKSQNVTWTRK